MSYSISTTGTTKAAVIEGITIKMAEIVAQQPSHAVDEKNVVSVVTSFVNLIAVEPNENQQYIVSVNGSLGWNGADVPNTITSASVSVSAYITTKTA